MTSVPEKIEVRNLNPGEWVDFSEIGVPGVQLMGTSIKVAVFDNGTTSVCFLPPEAVRQIEVFVFLSLVLAGHDKMGRRELRFLRRTAGLSAAQLAEEVGADEAQITRMERGKGDLNPNVLKLVRAAMMRRMDALLREIPDGIRELNRKNLEFAQEQRTRLHENDLLVAVMEKRSVQISKGLTARREERLQNDSTQCSV